MGRKSIERERKKLSKKMLNWLDRLAILLKHENLEKLSMDDLARLSDISKSTIYNYFQTKEEILIACINRRIEKLESFELKAIDNKSALVEEYLRLVEWICYVVDDISIHFINQIKNHFPDAWVLAEAYINFLLEHLKQLYTEGMKMGAFNQYPIDLLVGMDKYFMMEYLSGSSSENKSSDMEPVIRSYLKLKLEGILM